MWLVLENLGKSESQAKTSHSYGKPLETAWVGLIVGWSRARENHQGGANSVSQVVGVSDMVPTCGFCDSLGGGLRQGTMASASTSFWEKAAAHPHPLALILMLDNSVPPHMSLMTFNLLPPCWISEGVSPSKSVHGPFKSNYMGL